MTDQSKWLRATATIVSVRREPVENEDGTPKIPEEFLFCPEYVYTVNGTNYRAFSSLHVPRLNSVSGDPVEILYDPENPANFVEADLAETGSPSPLVSFVGLGVMVLMMILLLLLFR